MLRCRILFQKKHFLGLFVYTMLSGCFGPPIFLGDAGDEAKINHTQSVAIVESVADKNGVVTAVLDSNSNDTQVLQLKGLSSGLAGAKLSFPPGSLAPNTSLTIQEGASLASALAVSGAGTGAVVSVSPSLVVIPSNRKDPILPMTLSLPIGDRSLVALLAEDDLENLVVAYKHVQYANGEAIKLGVIPRSNFTVIDGLVYFETPYFGSFQIVRTERLVTAAIEVKTKEAIVTKIEEEQAESEAKEEDEEDSDEDTGPEPIELYPYELITVAYNVDTGRTLDTNGGMYRYTALRVVNDPTNTAITLDTSASRITWPGASFSTPDIGQKIELEVDVVDITDPRRTASFPLTILVDYHSDCYAKLGVGEVDPYNVNHWVYCEDNSGGLIAPQSSHGIVVPPGAVVAFPTETNPLTNTFYRIGYSDVPFDHANPGTLLIGATRTVEITTGKVYSSVALQSSTVNCTTCVFRPGSSYGINIQNSASLALYDDITVEMGSGRDFLVGSASSPGSLYTRNLSGAATRRPTIKGDTTTTVWNGILVNGSSADPSFIDIDGLSIKNYSVTAGGAALLFQNSYFIRQINKLDVHVADYFYNSSQSVVSFLDCETMILLSTPMILDGWSLNVGSGGEPDGFGLSMCSDTTGGMGEFQLTGFSSDMMSSAKVSDVNGWISNE